MSKTIHDIAEADRPREKLLRKGAKSLSDQELLAVLLGKGTPGTDVMTLASKLARLIDEKGLEVQADDLLPFDGVGDAKATLILAAIEFAAIELGNSFVSCGIITHCDETETT